jgi:hypothetical protein
MRFRPLFALLGLCLIVLTSGCCHDCWCSRHPYAPRCRTACPAPAESCGCCNPCAYPPVQSVAPPGFVAPIPH